MKLKPVDTAARPVYIVCELCATAYCHTECDNMAQDDVCFHRCLVTCQEHEYRRILLEIVTHESGLLRVIFAEECKTCQFFYRCVMVNMVELSFDTISYLDDNYMDDHDNYTDVVNKLVVTSSTDR